MSFVVPQIPASPDLALGARAYGFMLGGQGYMVSPGLYSELIKDRTGRRCPMCNIILPVY